MDTAARTKLRDFIRDLLHKKNDRAAFGDSDSLLETGRLDSIAATEVVVFLEREFGVDFARVDFDPQNFDSVDRIAAFVDDLADAA
jgi:acyl carrier protein